MGRHSLPRPRTAALAACLLAMGCGVRQAPEEWRPPGQQPVPAEPGLEPTHPDVPGRAPQPAPSPVPELDRPGFTWPLQGEILSRYGAPRGGRRHTGLDIRGRPGQPVLAAAPGTVVFSGTQRGYGRTVILSHGQGYETLYAHNDRLLVRPGQAVSRGQPLATVGRTGNATTEHCHFEVQVDGTAVDPLGYLDGMGRVQTGPGPGSSSGLWP